MKKNILFIVFILATIANFCPIHAQVETKTKSCLLVNGYLHIGTGEVLESALIGIKNGKISLVKNALTYAYTRSDWDTIIDVQGQHIYPGFIAPNSTLGLTEIDAVRATRDFEEVGQFNPHVRSQIAFNVESKVISTVRTNGVLMAQATPRGGDISGTSSIMALDGWNWEDATIHKNDGIHVNWPSSLQGGGWWAEPSPKKRNENYEKQKQSLYRFFEIAQAYASSKAEKEQRLEAMVDCFGGKKRVYFHANELQQLLDIVDFARKFDLSYPVIVGGYDSHLLADILKDAKIPVMLVRTHSLPENEDDPIDSPFSLAHKLQTAGVLYCLQNEGDMETMNARNLPFQAGTAMAYGLTEEQAVQSITLNTAKIVGIDKEYGSIEVGKSATLFVSRGNALDMRTNHLTFGMIRGVFLPLGNFQEDLYHKYNMKNGKSNHTKQK